MLRRKKKHLVINGTDFLNSLKVAIFEYTVHYHFYLFANAHLEHSTG